MAFGNEQVLDDYQTIGNDQVAIVDSNEDSDQLAGNAHTFSRYADDRTTGTLMYCAELVSDTMTLYSAATTRNLGDAARPWHDLRAATATFSGAVTISGTITTGLTAGQVVYVGSSQELKGEAGLTYTDSTDLLTLTQAAAGTGGIYLTDGTVTQRRQIIGTSSYLGNWSNHSLYFVTNSSSRWLMTGTGNFIANADNSYDIGASGNNRPRDLFVGTSIGINTPASGAAGDINASGSFEFGFDASTGETTTTGWLVVGVDGGYADGVGDFECGDGTRTAAFNSASMVYDVFGDANSFAGFKLRNTLNSSGAYAFFQTSVGGSSAGDPYFLLTVSGVINWSFGVDNDQSDKFCIGTNNPPDATNSALVIDTSGNVTLGGQLLLDSGNPTFQRTATNALVLIECVTSGDPYIIFRRTAANNWSVGLDDTDSDAFVIADGNSLGTTNRIRVDASSGDVTILQQLGVGAAPSNALDVTGATDLGPTGLTLATGDVAMGTSTTEYLWYDTSTATVFVQSATSPVFDTYFKQGTPTDASAVFTWKFHGELESGGGQARFAQLQIEASDVTAGTEDSQWFFNVYDAGTEKTASLINTGVWTDASSGRWKTYDRTWTWSAGSALATIARLDTGIYSNGKDGGAQHISPTAERWRDVTGLRGLDTGLAAKDLAGLALLGIGELNDQLVGLSDQVVGLSDQLVAVETRVTVLEREVARLRKQVEDLGGDPDSP